MKKVLIGLAAFAALFVLSTSSCTKSTTHTVTNTDTVTVVDTLKPPVGDTTYKHINDSLWAYYPLNGNLGDSSGNNHVLTLVGGGVSLGYDLWGNPQGALDFTAGSSYGEIADGANFNAANFSVSLFVMYRQLDGYLFTKVDYGNAFGGTFNVGMSPTQDIGIVRLAINTDVTNPCGDLTVSGYDIKDTTSESIQTYAWYHVVITFTNGVGTLYINSKLVATQTIPIPQLTECTNAPFILGNWWSQDNNPALNGKIDELRIYSRALSVKEIAYS